ncbi:MAG: SAM-dependent chlorinase/fluorinase [Candidatus Coatesbacteria bacterium]|nr:MAG: SAM-dependent chlorinase/fluorinase [Candidatus Coatesbacteria bacterium]
MAGDIPIITLTSDFGTADGYVACMKAVVLAGCPDARLVDITHEIPPGDVIRGALILEATVPHFPAGAIHLAVVDPGVGSERRGLALASGGYNFIGPDNGLFTPFLDAPGAAAYALPKPGPDVSTTFHGRDVFALASARLAAGADISSLGELLDNLVRLDWLKAEVSDDEIKGEIIYVDRFGNCVTSIKADDLGTDVIYTVKAAGRDVGPLRKYYAEVPPAEALALINSMGRLEIAVNGGSAEEALGLALGDEVTVRLI